MFWPKIFAHFWAYFEKHYFLSEMATLWATFGKIWATFLFQHLVTLLPIHALSLSPSALL